ncbi:unnamed protein product [Ambrosiozyma monospora]|uniref:Unnamed protein product n=1 Tax=Ambrosiozyma monospora TaxID=43982 RepID=A0ACB5UD46_AMBMO|nr:unnamed protein product [Ambrosiozyma monospora]
MLEILVGISLKVGLNNVETYNNAPFIVFQFNVILKILVYQSKKLITGDDSNDAALPIINFTNLLVSIITKLAYEYNNRLAVSILDEYNSKLEISLIDSFFHMNPTFSAPTSSKDKLSYFDDFIIADVIKQ